MLAERLTQNIAEIEAAFQVAPEACSEPFSEAMQTMLRRAATAREKGEKGPLRYMYVSYLQSSLYTGSYQLRLDAYDERQFGDITDAYAYWSPQFIFKHMDADTAYFRKHIGTHVLRVREHEIMRFAARYAMHYFRVVEQLVTALAEQFVAGADALTVLFGGYMDQALVLAKKEAEGDEVFPHSHGDDE